MRFLRLCRSIRSRTYSVQFRQKVGTDHILGSVSVRTNKHSINIEGRNLSVSSGMIEEDLQEVIEGKAKVLLPKSVFYNPVQEFNRDLTTSIISQFAEEYLEELLTKKVQARNKRSGVGDAEESNNASPQNINADSGGEGIRIFEGLAASGLRSVRFGLEVPKVKEVIANDFDRTAVDFIQKNIERNNLTGKVKASLGDASMIMYQHKDIAKRFDVIDIDPYGSAAQFMDAAVQSVCDGGLLCITCTDAAVLCGNASEACHAKYGSMSLRAKYCHEMGIRILLHCIESQANRYSRYIVPLVSLSIDFYFRLFMCVYTGQKQVKMSVTKSSMVYNCVGCGSFAVHALGTAIPTNGDNFKFVPSFGPPVGSICLHCGHKHQVGGPIWSAPLHNVDFLDKMLVRLGQDASLFGTIDRMKGMLSVAKEELQDVPLYYVLDEVCNTLHCTPPNMLQMRSALLNAGYRVSLSHAAKNSYKTDAPPSVIWDIMRCWVKIHPVSAKRLTEGSVAKAILDKEPQINISFATHPDANPASRQKGLVRWQHNPEPEWGPKPRARRCQDGRKGENTVSESIQNKTEDVQSGNGTKRAHAEEELNKTDVKTAKIENPRC